MKALKWIFVVFLIIVGLAYIASHLLGAALIIIAALLILPGANKIIEEKLRISKGIKYISFFALIIVGVIIISINEKELQVAIQQEKEQDAFDRMPKEKQDSIVLASVYQDSARYYRERREDLDYLFNSGWTKYHTKIARIIKADMLDPDSYELIESRYEDMGSYLIAYTKYRGNNAFGGKAIGAIKAKVDMEGNILEVYTE